MNEELNEQFWNLIDRADEAYANDDMESYFKLIEQAGEIKKQLVDTSCNDEDTSCNDEYTNTEADIAFS